MTSVVNTDIDLKKYCNLDDHNYTEHVSNNLEAMRGEPKAMATRQKACGGIAKKEFAYTF